MKSLALMVVVLCSASAMASDPQTKPGNVSWTFDQRLTDIEKRLAVVEVSLGIQQAPSPRAKVATCDCATTGVCTCGNGCACPKPAITSVSATLPPPAATTTKTTLVTTSGRTIELGADGLYRYVGDAPATTTTCAPGTVCAPGTTCAPAQSFQQFGGVPYNPQPVQSFQQFQPVQNFQQFQGFQQFQPRIVSGSCANGRCGR